MHNHARSGSIVLAAFAALSMAVNLVGCSGGDGLPRQPISGTINMDGKPLGEGQITFLPSEVELPTQGGAAIIDGKYSIPANEGLVPGKYRVTISSPEEESAKTKDMANNAPGMAPPPPKDAIPAKYNRNSELNAEVKAGDANNFSYELESAPSKTKK